MHERTFCATSRMGITLQSGTASVGSPSVRACHEGAGHFSGRTVTNRAFASPPPPPLEGGEQSNWAPSLLLGCTPPREGQGLKKSTGWEAPLRPGVPLLHRAIQPPSFAPTCNLTHSFQITLHPVTSLIGSYDCFGVKIF